MAAAVPFRRGAEGGGTAVFPLREDDGDAVALHRRAGGGGGTRVLTARACLGQPLHGSWEAARAALAPPAPLPRRPPGIFVPKPCLPAVALAVPGGGPGQIHSRSTSLGSLPPRTPCGDTRGPCVPPRSPAPGISALAAPPCLPSFTRMAPAAEVQEVGGSAEAGACPLLVVRNTFLEPWEENSTLDGFIRQRRVSSWPPSLRGPALAALPVRAALRPAQAEPLPGGPEAVKHIVPQRRVLQLAASLLALEATADWQDPGWGSYVQPIGLAPGLPSAGSVSHALGTCKPCAFVHTKGCRSGAGCKFCHLCEDGSRKQRKKLWRENRRAMAALAACAVPLPR